MISALLFSLGNHLQFIGFPYISSRLGAVVLVSASMLAFLFVTPFFLDPKHLSHPSSLYFVAVGIFIPAVTMSLAISGNKILGPTLQSSLASTGPAFAAVLGIFVFGEQLTMPVTIGIAGITCAVLLQNNKKSNSRDWPIWAISLPLAAVVLRVLGQTFTKIGLIEIADPFYAVTVSTVTSAVVLVVLYLVRPGPKLPVESGKGVYLFGAAGVVIAIGLYTLNVALLQGELIEVIPILSTAPIFSVIWSVIVFKRERITSRFLVCIVIVAISISAIALDQLN
ncbi:MAG: DMT family transporter [Rhodospirillales bacterium]|nr:DMT family transporter [Rhodospirillales bacterium]